MSDNGNYKIYIHRNKINGKNYIGQTCQDLEKRWGRNGIGYKENKVFFNDILNYGWSNFEHSLLQHNLTKEEANKLENYYINLFDTTNSFFGYNSIKAANNKEEKEEVNIIKEEPKPVLKIQPKQEPQQAVHSIFFNKPITKLLPGAKLQDVPRSKAVNGRKGRPVYSPELNLFFESAANAYIFLGMEKTNSRIAKACQDPEMKLTCGIHPKTGLPLHWRYLDELECSA